MNCSEIQNALLETPVPRDSVVAEHLATCAACRRFAAMARAVAEIPTVAPSSALDQAVLGAASLRLAHLRLRRQRRLGWLAAAAAVAVLLGWLAVPGLLGPRQAAPVMAKATPATPSIWADGELEAALREVEAQVSLLTSELPHAMGGSARTPTIEELDDDLLDFELRFYFERAVLGTIEPPAAG